MQIGQSSREIRCAVRPKDRVANAILVLVEHYELFEVASNGRRSRFLLLVFGFSFSFARGRGHAFFL